MQKSEKTVVADENFALRADAATDWGTGRNSKGSSTSACPTIQRKVFLSKFPSNFFPELNNFHLYKWHWVCPDKSWNDKEVNRATQSPHKF